MKSKMVTQLVIVEQSKASEIKLNGVKILHNAFVRLESLLFSQILLSEAQKQLTLAILHHVNRLRQLAINYDI